MIIFVESKNISLARREVHHRKARSILFEHCLFLVVGLHLPLSNQRKKKFEVVLPRAASIGTSSQDIDRRNTVVRMLPPNFSKFLLREVPARAGTGTMGAERNFPGCERNQQEGAKLLTYVDVSCGSY